MTALRGGIMKHAVQMQQFPARSEDKVVLISTLRNASSTVTIRWTALDARIVVTFFTRAGERES